MFLLTVSGKDILYLRSGLLDLKKSNAIVPVDDNFIAVEIIETIDRDIDDLMGRIDALGAPTDAEIEDQALRQRGINPNAA